MLDDKTLALLGDKAAAERLTERGELLPCRCNHSVLALKSYKRNGVMRNYIVCSYCGSQSRICGTEKEAFRDWNTRFTTLTPEQIKRLEEME